MQDNFSEKKYNILMRDKKVNIWGITSGNNGSRLLLINFNGFPMKLVKGEK